jgi:hypothetical protein
MEEARIIVKYHESKRIAIFCFCHTAPLFNIPFDWNVIWLGRQIVDPVLKNNNVIRLDESNSQLDSLHDQLGGSAGVYLLSEFESTLESVDAIGLFQYRKIISRSQIGIQAENYPVMRLINTEVANSCLQQECFPDDCGLLISKPLPIPSIIGQYAGAHYVEDFLKYTAIAVEENVIDSREVHVFMNLTRIFPGGVEFGFLPQPFALQAIKKIRTVSEKFIKSFPCEREGYQRRIASFCGERLGSFLLEKYLSQRFNGPISPSVIGQMTTITNEINYIPGT